VGHVFPGRRGYHINNAHGPDGLKPSKIQGSYTNPNANPNPNTNLTLTIFLTLTLTVTLQ